MEFVADCRARLAFDLLAHKWNSVVVWVLRKRPAACSPGHCAGSSRTGWLPGGRSVRRLGASLLGPIEMVGEWAYQHGDDVLSALDESTVDGVTSAMI